MLSDAALVARRTYRRPRALPLTSTRTPLNSIGPPDVYAPLATTFGVASALSVTSHVVGVK